MIIGINGKIGSGKDTIGEIIQFLTNKDPHTKVTTFSKGLNWSWGSSFEIKKFAGKLKLIGSILTGVPVEYFEDQDFKKKEMSEEWWYWSNSDNTTTKIPYTEQTKILANSDSDIVLYKPTYREFLQKLGTEAMRDGLHENVWVSALFADYKATPNKTMDESFMEQFVTGSSAIRYTYPNWIITDMRFPNEMEAVKEKAGITIRVVRQTKEQGLKLAAVRLGKLNATMQDIINVHPSETALDDAEFDYEIINDAGIPELIEKVKEILIKEKLI
jgi:hypothetical protein